MTSIDGTERSPRVTTISLVPPQSCVGGVMANHASCVESVGKLALIWIVIAFHMNVDIADDEQWIGKRDDGVQDIRQLADRRGDGRRWRSVDRNRYARRRN